MMALEVGDPVKGTGLSGAIAAVRKRAFPKTYKPGKDPLVKKEAEAIINYFKENAEIEVEVDVQVNTGTGVGTGEGSGTLS